MSARRRAAVCAALALGGAILFRAPAPAAEDGEAWPWSSVLAFRRADAAEVIDRLDVTPLVRGEALDARLVELRDELDSLQSIDLLLRYNGLETPVAWGRRSVAHPQLGIVLDRRLRAGVDLTRQPERAAEALRFVLAVQLARTLQLRTYSLESLSRTASLRHVEAQAFVLAGVLLSQNRGFGRRGGEHFRQDVERGIRLSARLRSPPWVRRAAPSPEQRRRLVLLGAQAGTFYTAVWNCRTIRAEPGNDRLVARVVRQIGSFLEADAGLPGFDPSDCQAEDVFDWSMRVARDSPGPSPAAPG